MCNILGKYKSHLMTEMSRPEGSLFLFTALLYLPESAAIFFTAAAPKQEDRGARSLYWILGDVVQRNRPQWWHRTLRHKCKQRDKSTYYFIIYFAVIRKHYNWSRVIKCLILYWLKTHQKWFELVCIQVPYILSLLSLFTLKSSSIIWFCQWSVIIYHFLCMINYSKYV